MYCCACGETLQPDRAKRFLQHMNATWGGGMAGAGAPRACIVPELQVRGGRQGGEGGDVMWGGGMAGAGAPRACIRPELQVRGWPRERGAREDRT